MAKVAKTAGTSFGGILETVCQCLMLHLFCVVTMQGSESGEAIQPSLIPPAVTCNIDNHS